jgi:hypothetical protein
MFGLKISPSAAPTTISAGPGEHFTLKNVVLVGAAEGESFLLLMQPDGAPSPFAVAPLSASSPHVVLDVPFDDVVELTLESTTGFAPKKTKAVAHVLGLRISEDDDEDEPEDEDADASVRVGKQDGQESPKKRARVEAAGASEDEGDDEGEDEEGEDRVDASVEKSLSGVGYEDGSPSANTEPAFIIRPETGS